MNSKRHTQREHSNGPAPSGCDSEHDSERIVFTVPDEAETNTRGIARGDRVTMTYESVYSPEPQPRSGIVTSVSNGITIDTYTERRANVPIMVRLIPHTGRVESVTGNGARTIGQLLRFEKEPGSEQQHPEEHRK